jgi:hypothetical protein
MAYQWFLRLAQFGLLMAFDLATALAWILATLTTLSKRPWISVRLKM